MGYGANETDRRMNNLVRWATVTAVDAGQGRVKVTFGDQTDSAWLPWTSPGAGTVKLWSPLAVGEQVLVASPSGDTTQGVIVGSLFSSSNASPSGDGGEFRLSLGGSFISMTDGAIVLSSNGSTITLDADGIRAGAAQIDLN